MGILLCYSSYPGKVIQLETRLRRLERKQRGESEMSRVINELIGKDCEIDHENYVDWEDKLGEVYPDMSFEVGKTRISFRTRRPFAMASLPDRRMNVWPKNICLCP